MQEKDLPVQRLQLGLQSVSLASGIGCHLLGLLQLALHLTKGTVMLLPHALPHLLPRSSLLLLLQRACLIRSGRQSSSRAGKASRAGGIGC